MRSHPSPRRAPAEITPLPGSTIEIVPGILWARLPLPFPLRHVNIYMIRDADGWSIIDAGADIPSAREQWLSLLSSVIGNAPVKRVIVTHFHPDHVGAAGWLCAQTGAPLVMTAIEHAAACDTFRSAQADIEGYRGFFVRHGVAEHELDKLLSVGYDYRLGVEQPPASSIAIDDGDKLSMGGRTFEVVVGAGHSPRLAMLYDREDDLLICADQVLQRISPNISVRPVEPDADPLGDYLTSLAQLRATTTTQTYALPGHESPIVDLHGRIAELEAHHADRCRAIELACERTWLNAAELVPHMFGRTFSGQQLGHALAETIAHVNFLLAQGRLQQQERGGVAVFGTR